MSGKIFYYTKYGNSALFAESLSEKKEISTVELAVAKKRKGRIGFMMSGYESVRRKKIELINNPWDQVADEKTIYLIFPIWAGNIAPAMRAFILGADFEGKEIIGISLQADPNAGAKIDEEFKTIIRDSNGTVKALYKFHGAGPGDVQDKSYYDKLATQID